MPSNWASVSSTLTGISSTEEVGKEPELTLLAIDESLLGGQSDSGASVQNSPAIGAGEKIATERATSQAVLSLFSITPSRSCHALSGIRLQLRWNVTAHGLRLSQRGGTNHQ
jgi:hypothetical protein